MALEIEGKVFQMLPEQTGTSQASGKAWRKQGFVIETEEQYPKKAVFNTWNETVDALKSLKVGDKVRIQFRIESREFNDRWYTDLTAWRIVKISEQALNAGGTPPPTQEPPDEVLYGSSNNSKDNDEMFEDTDVSSDSQEDDLPF